MQESAINCTSSCVFEFIPGQQLINTILGYIEYIFNQTEMRLMNVCTLLCPHVLLICSGFNNKRTNRSPEH